MEHMLGEGILPWQILPVQHPKPTVGLLPTWHSEPSGIHVPDGGDSGEGLYIFFIKWKWLNIILK